MLNDSDRQMLESTGRQILNTVDLVKYFPYLEFSIL
jgi:hypothetical protein